MAEGHSRGGASQWVQPPRAGFRPLPLLSKEGSFFSYLCRFV